MFAAAISLVGLAATVYLVLREAKAVRAQSGTVAKSALGWSVAFGLFQLFLTIWGAIGLVAQNEPLAFVMLILTNAILTGCAWASIARDRIAPRIFAFAAPDAPAPTGKLARLRGAFVGKPLVAAVLCLLLAGVFALLGMEVSSNHDFTWVYPLCILLEWGIITALMVGLFFLFQRHGAAPAVLAFALFVLGIAEFFVITFKSMPIQPGDLSAISTAAAVAGTGYTFSISLFCVLSMGFTAIAMLLCEYAGLVAPHRQKGAANAKRMLLTNLLVAVLCLGGVTAHVTLIDYYNTLGITVYTWRPLESYWREGYLPAFISAAQSIKPPKPADYSVDDAKATLKKYAKAYDKSNAAKSDERAAAKEQFDSEKPTVIAIMNETFSDLSIYQNMRAGYEGPQYFKSLSNCLSRAKLYAQADVDILFLGDDIGMQQTIMMSEEMYTTWIKPRLKKIIGAAKAVRPDLLVFYHSCGYIEPFIPHLIEVGVDVLNPIQPECMDVEKIFREYGDRLSFHGTIGTQSVMPFGTPEEVRANVKRNLDLAGDKSGLFVAPTHLLEPAVPWENIRAYVEACQNYTR